MRPGRGRQRSVSAFRFILLVVSSCLVLVTMVAPAVSAAGGGGGGASPGGGGASPAAPGSPPPGGAGVPLQMELIRGCTVQPGHGWTPADNLDLSRKYNDGDWKGVEKKLEGFIQGLTCRSSTVPGGEFHDRFPPGVPFSVVFLNEALEAPVLMRVLVQRPRPEIFGTRAAGSRIYDLQLFADSRLLATSRYQATAAPNPLSSQVSSVLSQVSGALLKAPPPGPTVGAPGAKELLAPEEITPEQSVSLPGFALIPPDVYVVHLVHLQRAFGRPFSTVVPQVAVSDQLASGVAVDYLLKALAERSRSGDQAAEACTQARAEALGHPGKLRGKLKGVGPDGVVKPLPAATVLIVRDSLSRSHPPVCKDDPVSAIDDSLRAAFLVNCASGMQTGPSGAVTLQADGAFRLKDLAAGQYWIQASGPGTGAVVIPVALAPGESKDLGDIVLPPGSAAPPDPAICAKALGKAVDDFAHSPPIGALDEERRSAAIERVENLYATYSTLAAPTQLTSPAPGAQYTMGKLTRFGFSLGLAVLGRSQLNTPAKTVTTTQGMGGASVTSLAANPPTNPLTFVAVDYHLPRYDETRFSPTLGERFRAYLGVAITPDPGAVAGLGFGIVRGLAVELGYSVLLENVLARGERLGQPVSVHSPTPRKGVGALFAGIGYSFQ